MATYTTNLSLKKPATSDKIRIADINGNFDTLDSTIGSVGSDSIGQNIKNLGGAIAIISNNNTHAAVAAGQYVYVHNHGTLNDGLYTADSAIAQNGTLSSSNVTAVSNGGLNVINDKITMYNIGNSYATLAAFESALTTFGSSMENSSSRPIRFTVGTAFGVFPTGVYQGTFSRHTDGRYAVEVKRFSGSAPIYTGNYNTSWSWMCVSDNSYEFTCLKNGGKLQLTCSNTTSSVWLISTARGTGTAYAGCWLTVCGSTSGLAQPLLTAGSSVSMAFNSTSNKMTLTNSGADDVYVSVIRLYGVGTMTGTQA